MKLEPPVGSHLAFDKDDQKAHGVKEKFPAKDTVKSGNLHSEEQK